MADACVITLSCVVLQQCFRDYISGKLLMVIFSAMDPARVSLCVTAERHGVMQRCEKNKALTSTSA